jgi:RimJ/RimL family protein N-acetyltransferase
MITGGVLVERVLDHWGKRFNAPVEQFSMVGSHIISDASFLDTGNVNIYHVGEFTFVRMDPSICVQLQLSDGLNLPSVLTLPDLAVLIRLGMRHTAHIDLVDTGGYFYLDPHSFKPVASLLPGNLVQVDPRMDSKLIANLCQDCPALDVEDAEISADEPDAVIFGHLLDGKLISYAGFRTWDEVFADIGVLTHPQQRGHGLARAATSMLCTWCIEHGIIPMYRVSDDNQASRRIPEALGFSKMVEIEVLKVVA